jgi:hypothetical protein
MRNRFLWVILYYIGGFALAWAAYAAEETHYAHGPGPRELIVLLTLIGGVCWFVVTLASYVNTRTAEKKAALLAHVLVFVSITIFAYFLFNQPDSSSERSAPEIVLEESGDTVVIRHDGNLVYYKVGDSVLINFIDSAKIDWDKVKYRKND